MLQVQKCQQYQCYHVRNWEYIFRLFLDLAEHAIEKRIRIFKPDLIFRLQKIKT